MEWLIDIFLKYWYLILIIGYYLYTGIKNASQVNKDRPHIPDNQPDIKPQPKRKPQFDRPNPTTLPIPQVSRTTQAPKPQPAPKKEKTFEEAMGDIFGQYDTKKGEGYGNEKPFSYNREGAQPIAEPAKNYKFGDDLVGDITKKPQPRTMALRGEIGSEDETPTKRKLAFSPRDAVKYSIMLERKYFDV